MIKNNSKLIQKGDTFVCVPNEKADEYLAEAIERGASKVAGLSAIKDKLPAGIDFIETQNPRLYLAEELKKQRQGKQPKTCIAVTGTNGKTSVVNFIYQIWQNLGIKSASLGTLGLQSPLNLQGLSTLTTPDPLTFNSILEQLHDSDVQHFAFEASSHGLDQHRLDGCDLSAVGFTNLSHDHMDYHKSVEDYFMAKRRLFTDLSGAKTPKVIFSGCPYGKRLIGALDSVTPYGRSDAFTVKEDRLCFREFEVFKEDLKIFGEVQYLNLLCAVALVESTGIELSKIIPCLKEITVVPGRLEYIKETKKGAKVFVDYAHTPDALKHALESLRPFTPGRLFVVFGCGGERDAEKRPVMGKIASAHADVVIVTDDNPRRENPDKIRFDVLKGCSEALEVPEREEAIIQAMYVARHGDIILIAGKGHETYQDIQGVRYKFSDKDCVEGTGL